MTGYTPIYNLPYPEPSDLVSAYPGTGQDLAEEVETVLAAKIAYALPKNAQTGTTYTFALADANKLVTASNAAASTYTIPPQSSITWTADTVIRVVNYGAGVVTFAGGSGVTVTNTAATLAQYQSAALVRTASDAWTVVPFSGGASKATVTATTGSPTVDTTSRPGKTIYIFNGSGSITTTAGTLELLVSAGGGGGGGGFSGGGGGGGTFYLESCLVSGATHTVTVGGGGAIDTIGSNSSFAGFAYGFGGGSGSIAGGSIGGANGGSGGGAGGWTIGTYSGGTGISGQGTDAPSTTVAGPAYGGGGGSGATAAGIAGSGTAGGNGGAGLTSTITGSSVVYGSGGGGGCLGPGYTAGTGGTNAGNGRMGSAAGSAGTANRGGGGGGGGYESGTYMGYAGGSGLVIVVIG